MNEITDEIVYDVIKKIESHEGISEFVKNISKFEGWLKVEVIESAIKYGASEVIPEKNWIDVTFKNKSKKYAVELKTINTNYQKNYNKKIRPITKNIQGVIIDINSLKKNKNYDLKYILFIVFPLDLELNKNLWKAHFEKINLLAKLKAFPIKFLGDHKGILYLGEVK